MASCLVIPRLASASASASVAWPLPAAKASSMYAAKVAAFGFSGRRKRRGLTAVRRAAGSSYAFAFILPLSLIAVTVFTSIRVADKLDQQFLEELAVEEAIKEGEDAELEISMEVVMDEEAEVQEEPVFLQRTRNRPKREA